MRIITVIAFLVILSFPLHGQEEAHNTDHTEDEIAEHPAEHPAQLPAEHPAQLPAEHPAQLNYGFSLGAQFGFIHGQAFELVFPLPNKTKGELLSELIWDMKPVFYLGIKADFERFDLMSAPGFFASVSFKAGIPANSGIMEDRDWQSIENDALTNFSSHDNKTDKLFMADIITGASIPVKTYFYVKPFLSGSWMHFSFSASDGYRKYAREKIGGSETYYPIDDNPDTGTFSGKVITYSQDWFLLAAGFSIGTKILSPFLFNISFKITPLIYCAATDHHLAKNYVFKDFSNFGIYIEPAACVSFVYKKMEFSLDFSYRHIENSKGKSYSNEGGRFFYLASNEAGAELSVFDTRFLFIVHF